MNLYTVLPDFPINDFSNILPSLERHHISVSDLLTLDAADVAKRAQIPTREATRLTVAVLKELHAEYGFDDGSNDAVAYDGNSVAKHNDETSDEGKSVGDGKAMLCQTGRDLVSRWQTISTLDPTLDQALHGGIPLGYLTEITGESGVGKTQLLLTLLLSAQLSPDHGGISRSALYLTTEAPLQTTRLSQMIKSHPELSTLTQSEKPSLNRIFSMSTPDLESQDHILRYQVPVAIKRHSVGLLVIDSITANFRAELDRSGNDNPDKAKTNAKRHAGQSMAKRTAQLMALGTLLRDLAREYNIAVVVANQVADRFLPMPTYQQQSGVQTPAPSSHPPPMRENASRPHAPFSTQPSNGTGNNTPMQTPNRNPLTLNHQQNFFTGWGDVPPYMNMKTPSLGLVWSNEIAARIALVKAPFVGFGRGKAKRHFKVVFAPWCPPAVGRGVEYEITAGGLQAVLPRSEADQEAKGGDVPVAVQ